MAGDSKYLPTSRAQLEGVQHHAQGRRGENKSKEKKEAYDELRLRYAPLTSWSCDLLEYNKVSMQKHYRYAMNFIELHTGYVLSYFMTHKSEAPKGFEFLRRYVRSTLSQGMVSSEQVRVRHVWCDNAKEFLSEQVQRWAARYKINVETTSPYVHWQNARVENMNKRVAAITRKLLRGARHPGYCWPFAHQYALTSMNSNGPFEKVMGRKFDMTNVQPYGTPVTIAVQDPEKLEDRSELAIYMAPAMSTMLTAFDSPLSHLVLRRHEAEVLKVDKVGDVKFNLTMELAKEAREKVFGFDDLEDAPSTCGTSEYFPDDVTEGSGTERSKPKSKAATKKSKSSSQATVSKGNKSINGVSLKTPSSTASSSPTAPPGLAPIPKVTHEKSKSKVPKKASNLKAPKIKDIPMKLVDSIIRRKLPVVYMQMNPKKGKSAVRWSFYCKARTADEAVALNPDEPFKKADLKYDLSRGLVRVVDEDTQRTIDVARGVVPESGVYHAGILIPRLKLSSGSRSIIPIVAGGVVQYEDPRFTITTDIKELKETPEHLRQSMYDAIVKEIKTLLELGTWSWATKPSNRRAMGTRIVLKTKYKANGEFDKHKARLVVKGYLQKQGLDFTDTFTPTSHLGSFRTLLSLAARRGWRVMHADIKNAFCNAEIDVKELYINMPDGIDMTDDNPGKDRCLRLNKALYGLRQAPRLWFEMVKKLLVEKGGFTQGKTERTLFIRKVGGTTTRVLVYVDDIIITGGDPADHDRVRDLFKNNKLEVGEYSSLMSYLGMAFESLSDYSGFTTTSEARVEDILKELPSEIGGHSVKTTAMVGETLENHLIKVSERGPSANVEYLLREYRHVVGEIMYLSTTMRPDIAVAVSRICGSMNEPRLEDALQLQHLLRYLNNTKSYKMEFKKRVNAGVNYPKLEVYTDSSFAEKDDHERKSRTGVIVTVDGNPVFWKTKRQKVTAVSTHEAELLALWSGVQEALFFRRLLEEMGEAQPASTPVYVDNQSAVISANTERDTTAHRHLDVRFFRIRDHVRSKDISVLWKPGHLNPADLLTKVLNRDHTLSHVRHIMNGDSYSPSTVLGGGDGKRRSVKGRVSVRGGSLNGRVET